MIELNEEQICLIEHSSPELRERQIQVLTTQENWQRSIPSLVRTLKRIGRCTRDCYSRHAQGQLYTSKLPVTSVDLLNEKRYCYSSRSMRRGFCGRPDHHPHELLPHLTGIEHCTTKVHRPKNNRPTSLSNGSPPLQDDHFRLKGRTICYQSVGSRQTQIVTQSTTIFYGHIRAELQRDYRESGPTACLRRV